jgi:hypothetical protein
MGWRVRRLIPDGGEIFCFLTGNKIITTNGLISIDVA